MPLNWMDLNDIPLEALLLLEKVQISWIPNNISSETQTALGTCLRAKPTINWYLGHKCPDIHAWLENILQSAPQENDPVKLRQAELLVLQSMMDWIVYVWDPSIYDKQPFLLWDSSELTNICDFSGKTVVDIGAGTGRLAFSALNAGAAWIYAVEPVGNLREYMLAKAKQRGFANFSTVDGLITRIPFEDQFADICMGGHVFGDDPAAELAEMVRVTHKGGWVILCPGNNDYDNALHHFLTAQGFQYGRFEEPQDGWKRKYWKQK